MTSLRSQVVHSDSLHTCVVLSKDYTPEPVLKLLLMQAHLHPVVMQKKGWDSDPAGGGWGRGQHLCREAAAL